MKLKGKEVVEISKALLAYFTQFDLDELTLYNFDRRLDEIVPSGPLQERAMNLVDWANRSGNISDLVRAAFAERSKVAEWQEFNRLYGSSPAVSLQDAGTVNDVVAGPPAASAIERTIGSRLGFMDMGSWAARLSDLEVQVCRVERDDAKPVGTGFLVGPDLVLTAHHNVLQGGDGSGGGSLQCRFDYKRLGDGSIQQGHTCALALDWLAAFSPPSATEAAGRLEDDAPGPDELDFALLRLAEPLGGMAISSARTRSWISLPVKQPLPQPGSGLIIVQHPAGGPIKVALDTNGIVGVNANGTRLRYTTMTEPGSAGSPCFDLDWSLVAMHHASDPGWLGPKYRQGIPIGLIADRIAPFLPGG